LSSLVLIDSSAWLFALGDNSVSSIRNKITYLLEQNLAATTSPILFELLSGIKNKFDEQRLKEYLLTLHIFPLQPEEWIEAADWTRSLRMDGLKIKTIDSLIAYKAIKHNLVLLHADMDLDRIAQKTPLRVESYVSRVRKEYL